MHESIQNAETAVPMIFAEETDVTLDISQGLLIDVLFDDPAFDPQIRTIEQAL